MILLPLLLVASSCQRFDTTHTTIIPSQSYAQLMINPIRMFSHEFDPGSLSLLLDISTSKQPVDLILYASANSSAYQCYINTISYSELSDSCFSKAAGLDCQSCDLCYPNMSHSIMLSLTGTLDKDLCCIDCEHLGSNIINIPDMQLNDLKTRSPLLLFDNTKHPNQPGQGEQDVNLTIRYIVTLATNKTDYHETLALVFAFIVMITVLTIVVCIMNHKYKKAKDRQFNASLVSGIEEKKSRFKET